MSVKVFTEVVSEQGGAKEIVEEARKLGRKVRHNMDPVCDEHLDRVSSHPLNSKFSKTKRFQHFKKLLAEMLKIESEGRSGDIPEGVKVECKKKLISAFDNGFKKGEVDKISCVVCGKDGISVGNPEATRPENVLSGRAASGRVNRDKFDEEAKWQ